MIMRLLCLIKYELYNTNWYDIIWHQLKYNNGQTDNYNMVMRINDKNKNNETENKSKIRLEDVIIKFEFH